MVGLFIFHNFLIIIGMTTNEYLKKVWEIESRNPFQNKQTYINFFILLVKQISSKRIRFDK